MTAVKRKKRAARGHQPGCGVLNLRNCPLDLRQALKVEALRLGVTLEALCVGLLTSAMEQVLSDPERLAEASAEDRRVRAAGPSTLGAAGPKISNKGGALRGFGAAVATGSSEEIVAAAMGDPGLRGLPEGATCSGGAGRPEADHQETRQTGEEDPAPAQQGGAPTAGVGTDSHATGGSGGLGPRAGVNVAIPDHTQLGTYLGIERGPEPGLPAMPKEAFAFLEAVRETAEWASGVAPAVSGPSKIEQVIPKLIAHDNKTKEASHGVGSEDRPQVDAGHDSVRSGGQGVDRKSVV